MAGANNPAKPEGSRPGGALPEKKGAIPPARPARPAKDHAPITARPEDGTPTLEAIEADIYTDEAVEVRQAATAQPDTTAEKRAQWRLDQTARKMAKKEAGQTAIILLSLLDGIAFMAFGAGASMNEYERDLMKEPLERILMRMDITSSEALSKWSDPILLVMGIVAWGSRLMQERRERENEETKDEILHPAEDKKPDNGKATSKADEFLIPEQLRPPQTIRGQVKGGSIQ